MAKSKGFSSGLGAKLCTHGLSDNMDILSDHVVKGPKAVHRSYFYYCRDHDHYGNFTITAENKPTLR